MQVIVTQNVAKLGTRGEVKNVRPGYFRNFLLPGGFAIAATKSNMKAWEKLRERLMKEKTEIEAQAKEIAEKLKGVTLTVAKKVTKKATFYSAVSVEDIVEALKKEAKISLSPQQVDLPDHLKKPGTYTVSLALSDSVKAEVKLEAVGED